MLMKILKTMMMKMTKMTQTDDRRVEEGNKEEETEEAK